MYPAAEAANRSAALLLRCTALRFPSPMCTGLRHVRGQGRKRGRGMRTRPGEAFSAPPPARRWRFSLAPGRRPPRSTPFEKASALRPNKT